MNSRDTKTLFKNVRILLGLAIVVLGLSSCAKEAKNEDLSFDELSEKAEKFSTKKKKGEEAIACLEEIVGRFSDHEDIAQYKMKLAEKYFDEGQYPSAQEMFDHFNQFYPADKQAEYAKYKSVQSMFYQTLRIDCDQTETEEAHKLCQEYLKNAAYKKYRKEVVDIQTRCENKLIDKEVYVFNFYVKHENYDAARNRLKHLRDKYLANNVALEARLLYLECSLAYKEKDHAQVNKNINKLLKDYPDSQFTQMAESLITKRPFIF